MSDLSATELAREWRAYVLDKTLWTESLWESAEARGLAVRRASRDQSSHFWTLTDAGLDLMLLGEVH